MPYVFTYLFTSLLLLWLTLLAGGVHQSLFVHFYFPCDCICLKVYTFIVCLLCTIIKCTIKSKWQKKRNNAILQKVIWWWSWFPSPASASVNIGQLEQQLILLLEPRRIRQTLIELHGMAERPFWRINSKVRGQWADACTAVDGIYTFWFMHVRQKKSKICWMKCIVPFVFVQWEVPFDYINVILAIKDNLTKDLVYILMAKGLHCISVKVCIKATQLPH